MKKLLITMMAILAFNVSYANGTMGEESGIPNGECSKTRGDASRSAKELVGIPEASESSKDSTYGSSVIGG